MSGRLQRLAGAALLALACIAPSSGAAETVAPLFTRALPNIAGKTLTAVQVDFAGGGGALPHRHGQAFVFAYVLSGGVRSQLAGEPPRTYRAGESWFEPPGAQHVLTQNVSRTHPAHLLVVFVADTWAALKTPSSQEEKVEPMLTNPGPASPTTEPPPQAMNDALYMAFGDHHSRAVHAKGVMAEGTFEPTLEAAHLSKATVFSHGRLAVLSRFSDFTGIPTISDTAGEANPRGFAIKIALPDGSSADVVSHSFNGFPTATSAEFRELLLAIGASGPGVGKPTPLEGFLATHPIAAAFLTTQKPSPQSYASLTYFGVNTFAFTNAHGRRTYVRYRFVPEDGEALLSPAELATKNADYLQRELPARLANHAAAFTWYAQLAESADVLDDPSTAWPENRRLVKLGVIRLDRPVRDQEAASRATSFQPLNVPHGIAPADPMLGVRQGAYPLSFNHRQ